MVTSLESISMGFKKRFSVVGLMATIYALSGCAPTISGNLLSTNGDVIMSPEARVNIVPISSSEDEPQVLEVGSEGEFKTTETLKKGFYLVEALVPGYAPISVKVDVQKSENILLKLSPAKKIKNGSFGYYDELDEGRGQGGATLVPPMNY